MESFKINRIVFSAGAIIIGIVLLVWPETSLIVIAKCVGAVLACGGVVAGYMSFKDHETAMRSILMVMAVVMLICGIVIFMHPEELIKLIPMIMGILVLISGLIKLGETFMLTKRSYNRWWISLIIAIITIAAGIFLVKNAFSLAALITRIGGGILLFDGASDLWVISRLSSTAKSADEANGVVDAQAQEVKTEEAKPQAGNKAAAAKDTAAGPVPVKPAMDQPAAENPAAAKLSTENPAADKSQSGSTVTVNKAEEEKTQNTAGEPSKEPYKPDLHFGENETPEYMNQDIQDGEYTILTDYSPDQKKDQPSDGGAAQ